MKAKTIKMKNTVRNIDRDDYETIEDRHPEIIADIRKELQNNTPDEIGAFIRRERPHRWLLSKMIQGAARHILRSELK